VEEENLPESVKEELSLTPAQQHSGFAEPARETMPALSSARTAPFFSGSMPPQFQLDANFNRGRVLSERIPEASLMPFGPQGNPSTNAAIQSTAKTVVLGSADVDTDSDTPIMNIQTGTTYTVQQSDLNKVISINNSAGGTIYLPPVAPSLAVGINNINFASGGFFNSGNTTVVGQVATSVSAWTATGSPFQAGDTLMWTGRILAGVGGSATFTFSDSQNGAWTTIFLLNLNSGSLGNEYIFFAYTTNQKAVAIGSSITVTLKVTYSGTVFNPDANEVFNFTGLKQLGAQATGTGSVAPLAGAFTFGSTGIANIAVPSKIGRAHV